MEIIVFAMLLGLIPAMIASSKGYSFGLWWFYGALLFIIALPHSLIMSADKKAIEQKQLSEDMKKCPYCAEMIKKEAIVCRYCGKDLPDMKIEEAVIEENVADEHAIDKNVIDRNIVIDLDGFHTTGDIIDYANRYGYSKAKFLLAKIYLDGDIIETDLAQAKHWIQKAADEGSQEAIELLKKKSWEVV